MLYTEKKVDALMDALRRRLRREERSPDDGWAVEVIDEAYAMWKAKEEQGAGS